MIHEELVSIIVPVYNVKPFLTESLDSVVHQTYTNLEIIVVDDGSTDGSETICDEYARIDKRVRVIHQDNHGLSTARNVGINLASGDTIVFLDSDDAFRPDFVKIMLSEMIREEADLVICRYTTHRTLGQLERVGNQKPTIESGLYDRVSALQALADGKINHSVWN